MGHGGSVKILQLFGHKERQFFDGAKVATQKNTILHSNQKSGFPHDWIAKRNA